MNRGDGSNMHSAVARAAALYDILVIYAGHEIRAQAARVDLFERQFLAGGDGCRAPFPRFIDGLAVGSGGQCDVVYVFVASLDFQATNACFDDPRDMPQGRQVSGGQQITGIP